MARSKQEVRDFLNSLIGQMVNEKCGDYNGQCVSLIKALLEFVGAPNPYAARGNARDCGDTLIRQGIASDSSGWLNVCVNRDMGLVNGVRYGHIWVEVSGEMNFEQNGSQALRTTKNTRPVSQAQQIVNLDQYIINEGSDQMIIQDADNWYFRCNKTHWEIRGRELDRATFNGYVGVDFLRFVEDCSDDPEADKVQGWQQLGQLAATDNWQGQIYSLLDQVNVLGSRPTADQLTAAQKQASDLQIQMQAAKDAQVAAEKKSAELETQNINAQQTGNSFLLWLGSILSKLKGSN